MKRAGGIEFDDGVLSTIFFYELRWLCENIKRNTDVLFETCKVPDEGFIIQINPQMHSVISSVLSDAANIKKLSVTASAKLNGENSERHQMRLARAKAVEDFLRGISLIEMHNVKVRNTLEHFAEYLDASNLEFTKKPKGTRAAYNMIMSHWSVNGPKVYPIRLYVSSERKFYNMEWVVDIGLLAYEAMAILNKFASEKTFGNDEGPSGILISV